MDFDLDNYLYQELVKCGAFKNGHFELSSGKHSPHYVQCAQFCRFPKLNEWAALEISKLISVTPDLVLSPAMGGLLVGYEVSRRIDKEFIFVEREKGAGPMKLRRDFKIKPGSNVLVVEDVITTGSSLREVTEILKENQANLVSVACIIDRTNGQLKIDNFISLLKVSSEIYNKEDCPLCLTGDKAIKPGSKA